MFALCNSNVTGLLQGEHPGIFAVISLKRGKIGPRLLLKSNRKSYALCFKTHASFGAHRENLNENRSVLSATKMEPND